jgi:hypothetical protein
MLTSRWREEQRMGWRWMKIVLIHDDDLKAETCSKIIAYVKKLTPWRWAILEKSQLLKNFPIFYGTRRFSIIFTKALHWSLSWARSIHSILPYPTSLRSILMLSFQLRLRLPSGLFPSGFPTKILYAFIFSTCTLHALPISSSSI